MGIELEAWIRGSQTACAVVAAGCAVAWFARSARALRAASAAALFAALAGLAALVQLGRLQAAVPLRQPPDVGLAAAVALLGVAAALAWRARGDALRPRALFAASAALLAAIAAQFFAEGHSLVAERAPPLRSAWLPVHAGAWSLALALVLAALLARLAARGGDAALARFARRATDLAFAAATLGLVSGCIWSLQAWSVLWAWEPKSIVALLAWMALAVSVLPGGVRPLFVRSRGWILAGAAAAMLVNLYGLQLVPSAYAGFALHSYMPDRNAWRDPSTADETVRALAELASPLAQDEDPAVFKR